MNRRILLPVLAAFILASPFLVRFFARSTATQVEVEPVRPRDIRETVLATGNLIYRQQALLSPEIIARVKTVLVKEGDEVTQGQVVITLEDENLRQAAAQQRAQMAIENANQAQQSFNVSNLKLQLDRVANLADKGFVSKAAYDSAYYALNAAKANLAGTGMAVTRATAELKQAKYVLDRTVIRAPMSGTVVSVNIKTGETAVPSATGIPGSSLLTIARKETIMVDLNVDENDVGRLALGSEAQIICPMLPDRGITGHLREIALAPRRAAEVLPINDATGRAYSVKAEITGPQSGHLRQGMSCRAKIFTSNPAPILAVPVQAVLSDQTTDDDGISLPQDRRAGIRNYVFVIDGDRVSRRYIHIGNADDAYQAVTSGLRRDEKVVVGPYAVLKSLVDGAKVLPKLSQGATNGATD
jgi:HlyD family secretion protein